MSKFIIAFSVFLLSYGSFQYGRVHDKDPTRPMPTWIGYGCDGAGGDLWSMDISDLPPCDEIERY